MYVEVNLWFHSSGTVYLEFKTGSLSGPELTKWSRLASDKHQGSAVSAFQHWDYKCYYAQLVFLSVGSEEASTAATSPLEPSPQAHVACLKRAVGKPH